jgi:putative transposase
MIFVEFLREQYANKRIVICWDGASYHRGEEMREYLEGLNCGKPRDEWVITCIQFAPHTPAQNPIENIWLQAKSFIRKNWRRCDTFQQVIDLFEHALKTLPFDFKRLCMYFT